MPPATLADVAHHAGVSLATVDRVINLRPGVSERTRKRVLLSARHLGYLISEDGPPTQVRLVFVLPEGTNSFVHELAQQLSLQAPLMVGVSATVERVRGFDPSALADKLRDLQDRVDGIAMLGMDHPIVRDTLRCLVARGLAVCTIGSDVRTVDHLGYVGIDDSQAGRTAGYLLGRLLPPGPCKVAFFAGSLAYRGHQEREMGFRQILQEEFRNLVVVDQCEVQDDRALAETEMTRILKRHPDLAGVYNAGGGTAGLAAALIRHKRGGKVRFIAHDATQGNKGLLMRGVLDAVIDQNARAEVRETLITLTHAARQQPYKMVPPRLQIVLRENIPVD